MDLTHHCFLLHYLQGGQASAHLDASTDNQQSVTGLSPGSFNAPSSGLQLLARVTLTHCAAFRCCYLPVHPENSGEQEGHLCGRVSPALGPAQAGAPHRCN